MKGTAMNKAREAAKPTTKPDTKPATKPAMKGDPFEILKAEAAKLQEYLKRGERESRFVSSPEQIAEDMELLAAAIVVIDYLHIVYGRPSQPGPGGPRDEDEGKPVGILRGESVIKD